MILTSLSRSLGGEGEQIALRDAECSAHTRPATVTPCEPLPQCHPTVWHVGPWDKVRICSYSIFSRLKECGRGTMIIVICLFHHCRPFNLSLFSIGSEESEIDSSDFQFGPFNHRERVREIFYSASHKKYI